MDNETQDGEVAALPTTEIGKSPLAEKRTYRGHRPLTQEDLDAFLEELRKLPNAAHASRQINRSYDTMRARRGYDPVFSAAWDQALQDGIESLEGEVHRRAFLGVERPIVFQGRVTGSYVEFSDTLAMFLLKAHRPEKYRERVDMNLTTDADLAKRIAAGRQRVAQGNVIEGEATVVQSSDGCEDLI